MKFIAANLSRRIKDKYGIEFKTRAIDEGNETLGFRIMLGLEAGPDYVETGSIYNHFKKISELYESLPRKHKLSLDEKFDSILSEEVFKKVESLMEKEDMNEITINREYLPEIFNKGVLEIFNDGFPTLKPFILEFLRKKGIMTEIFGKVIKFTEEN